MENASVIDGNITLKSASVKQIKELIEWIESRKSINVTIVIQSIGNIINSRLDNVNVNGNKI